MSVLLPCLIRSRGPSGEVVFSTRAKRRERKGGLPPWQCQPAKVTTTVVAPLADPRTGCHCQPSLSRVRVH